MEKISTTLRMAGEQDSEFNLRLPTILKDRIKKATTVGLSKTSIASVMRVLAEPYCEFTESQKRQPIDFKELCQWYLSK